MMLAGREIRFCISFLILFLLSLSLTFAVVVLLVVPELAVVCFVEDEDDDDESDEETDEKKPLMPPPLLFALGVLLLWFWCDCACVAF